jgi:hypothetical protein
MNNASSAHRSSIENHVCRRLDAAPPSEGALPIPKLQAEDDGLHDSVESTGTLGPVIRLSPPAVP